MKKPLIIISAFSSTLLVLCAAAPNKKTPPAAAQQPPYQSQQQQALPPPSPPLPSTKPGSQVQWITYPAQKNLSDASWGNVLTDIENHLPKEKGTQYRDRDKTTWAHETTHGIHSAINEIYFKSGHIYGLYVLNDKAAIITQPKTTITQVAAMIPASLRKSRYQLYLVSQRRYWDAEPLYLYDEWIAYTNGVTAGIELDQKGIAKYANKNDFLFSIIEFDVYALYVCMAAKKYDPSYDAKQLLEFTAWNLQRTMNLYAEGSKIENLNWDDGKYLEEIRTGQSAAELRQFVITTYGPAWAKEVMGFTVK